MHSFILDLFSLSYLSFDGGRVIITVRMESISHDALCVKFPVLKLHSFIIALMMSFVPVLWSLLLHHPCPTSIVALQWPVRCPSFPVWWICRTFAIPTVLLLENWVLSLGQNWLAVDTCGVWFVALFHFGALLTVVPGPKVEEQMISLGSPLPSLSFF